MSTKARAKKAGKRKRDQDEDEKIPVLRPLTPGYDFSQLPTVPAAREPTRADPMDSPEVNNKDALGAEEMDARLEAAHRWRDYRILRRQALYVKARRQCYFHSEAVALVEERLPLPPDCPQDMDLNDTVQTERAAMESFYAKCAKITTIVPMDDVIIGTNPISEPKKLSAAQKRKIDMDLHRAVVGHFTETPFLPLAGSNLYDNLTLIGEAYVSALLACPLPPWLSQLDPPREHLFEQSATKVYETIPAEGLSRDAWIRLWLAPCIYCGLSEEPSSRHRMDVWAKNADPEDVRVVPCCEECQGTRARVYKDDAEHYVEQCAHVARRYFSNDRSIAFRDVNPAPSHPVYVAKPEYEKRIAEYKKKSTSWQLSAEQCSALFESCCHYCGERALARDGLPMGTTGLELLRCDTIYSPVNAVACCKACSAIKNAQDHDAFLARCRRIALRWSFAVSNAL